MAQTRASARVAFQYPQFRLYQAARFLTITASEMQSVAVGWQIYDITHRPLDLGLVGLAQFLPPFVLFLFAGHAADRFQRKRIIMFCYGAFALCSALLFLIAERQANNVLAIYGVLLLIGAVRAFNGPAGQSFMPLLVPEEHFPNAVAWGSSVFMSATILGPSLGGIIYGIAGNARDVYLSASITFAVSVLLVAAIRLKIAQKPRQSASLQSVLNGLRFVYRTKLVLGAISLDLFAVLLGGAVALLPVYAREILNIGPRGLGILRAAPGVGAVITAIILAHWPLSRRAGLKMFWCVTGFGVCTVVFGLSRNVYLSLLALLLIGATDMVSVIVRSTMVQLATPDEMRGRVSAVNMIFIGASNEFGQFESGITAQWFGTVPAVVLGGVGTLLVVAIWALWFPELRKVDRLVAEEIRMPSEPGLTADPND